MHNKEPEDFWNLSDLVPKSRKKQIVPPHRDTAATEVTSPPLSDEHKGNDALRITRYVPPHTKEELQRTETAESTYRPTSGLIAEVRVYPWKNTYDYYEAFCRQARRLAGVRGRETPSVDFFSYMPQYAQMTPPQLSYYLWWRTNFEAGRCLAASYAYLLLYLYEIINLDTAIEPQTGRDNMVRLWLNYREKHPRLDVLVREWLCDYCLIRQLPPPALPAGLFTELIGGGRLREFYVTAADGTESMIDVLLYFGSNYDYKKSKFYRSETAALFDRALRGAARVALAEYETENAQNSPRNRGFCTVSRDAYSGAVCSYRCKRRIEVDYYSFSHTYDLRYLVTDVLKYAENAVRASLGIKSRLSVYAVNTALREKLDVFLRTVLPPRATRRAKEKETPDYEKRYDLPRSELSPAHAAAIEAASWQITERLVSAFSGEIEKSTETGRENSQNADFTPPVSLPPTHDEKTIFSDTLPRDKSETGLAAALGELSLFVRLCAADDRRGQREFARAHDAMTDAVADRVNTIAGDVFGDIILEEKDGAYTVVPEYSEELEKEGVL